MNTAQEAKAMSIEDNNESPDVYRDESSALDFAMLAVFWLIFVNGLLAAMVSLLDFATWLKQG